MNPLDINTMSPITITESFTRIAESLFTNFQLVVNENFYRLIDLEFYYFSPNIFKDIYAHQHPEQLKIGKWYFHGSGIDITIGSGVNYGGILIRGIAKLSGDIPKEKYFIEEEFHGPLNVKTEIGSKLNDVFSEKQNIFKLHNVGRDSMSNLMTEPSHIIKTKRIGLNPLKDNTPEKDFYNGNFRYVIFPHLKLKDKTKIALDMQSQYPELSAMQINKLFGSKFLS